MSRKFNVGDRVKTIVGPVAGTVTTIVGAFGKNERCPCCSFVFPDEGYLLDLPATSPEHTNCFAAYEPEDIRPYYDGNEKVSWSSCVWQPTSIRA